MGVTRQDQFDMERALMPDEVLIELCKLEISKMCKTGGRSFTMTIPVRVSDTDMLLSELIDRYKRCITIKTDLLDGKIEKIH